MAQRYVVTDPAGKQIVAGPFLWDPDAAPDWQPPAAGTLMLERDALQGGYAWPTAAINVTDANRDQITARLTSALAVDLQYLAIGTPTAAQVSAQVGRLTRQVVGLLRLQLGQLDDVSGT